MMSRPTMALVAGPGFFRLALALVVLFDHVSRVNLGSAAVYIFFILSGYWISVMWTSRYSKLRNSYGVYVVSRLWRLIPTFIFCSGIAWALLLVQSKVPPQISPLHQVLSTLFIVGYKSLEFAPIGPAWSLDIEVQFYMLAPLLVMIVKKSTAPWALLGCTLISLCGLAVKDSFSVVPYLVFFSVGVLSACFQWKPARSAAFSSLLGTVAIILLCLMTPLQHLIVGGAHPSAMYGTYNGAAEIALALCMAPWAIYTTRQPDSPTDGMFGDLSFIVYLLHWPIMNAIDTGSGSYAHRALMILVVFATTMAASVLVWKLFDRPVNRMRARWVSSRPTSGQLVGRIQASPVSPGSQ